VSIPSRKMSGHRLALMLSTSVLSMGAYGHLRSANAANECGVIAVGGTATCTPAGNNFATGIDYQVNDATIIVQDGVTINTAAANTTAITSGTAVGNYGNLAVTTNGTVAISTAGTTSHGISVGTANGSVQVTTSAQTSINVSGGTSAGILAYAGNANAITITSQGTITTSGPGPSFGIASLSLGGNINITGNTITQTGGAAGSYGVYAISLGGTGNINVTMAGVSSTAGGGIAALSSGTGTVSVTTTGSVTTYGAAITAVSINGDTSVSATDQVTTTGTTASNAILAYGGGGDVTITSNGVSGGSSTAIYAYAFGGAASVTDTGTVTGPALGIYAYSGTSSVSVTANNVMTTTSDGIYAYAATTGTVTVTGDINAGDDGIEVYAGTGITVTSSGTIVAADEGIDVTTAGGPTVITANNVMANTAGNDGIAINTPSTFDVTVTGAVSGGAGTAAGAGIDIRTGTSGTITVQNGASVGALSDFAMTSAATGATTINNSGTITGSLILGPGGTVLNNLSSNSVNLRRFTDTDADGVRDTEAVGLLLFGTGNDTFDNAATGTLRVSTVTGATAFDTANETFAAGSAALSLTNAGVEQGHIVRLETFINSGIITLADAETGGTSAVAGDVLAITSLIVPNAAGTSNFISNGGELHLDTVLDNGAVDTTDVLILDTATTGAGGATGITITNAGGAGAFTGTGATSGIRVVEVRGVGSASDAFTLSQAAVGGIFEYELSQADGQNWYLQSSDFARQIPAYQALPLALAGFARDQMPWAQKRWGHVEGLQEARTGAWLRGGYVRGSEEFGGTRQYESRDRFAQAGYDVVLDTGLPGHFSIGGLLQHTSTDTSVTNGNGSTFSASGYGAGLSAYWTTDSGLFLEALATLTRYEVDIERQNLANVADTDAYTYTAGLQVGHQFHVAGETDRWNITPRASLTFIDSDIDNFTDASGIAVDFAESDSMLLEAGMISGLDLDLRGNRILNLSAEIGIEHNLLGENSVTANGTNFSADRDNTRVTFGAGATAHLGDGFSIFVRAEGRASLAGEGHSEQASAGARITF
jgi:autotransporter family porin